MGELERSVGDRTRKPSKASDRQSPLLGFDEPLPVDIVNPTGTSPFFFVGDHAGKLIPAALGSLGLGNDDLLRHIGWDIGVGSLGEMLAARLDAVFVRQRYSRLVVDCNRDPEAATAIPPVSDGAPVPGNEALSAGRRAARIASIHEPYHRAIAAELNRRRGLGQDTIFVSLHSFTPALRTAGDVRPWQIGVLYDGGETSFARLL